MNEELFSFAITKRRSSFINRVSADTLFNLLFNVIEGRVEREKQSRLPKVGLRGGYYSRCSTHGEVNIRVANTSELRIVKSTRNINDKID